MNPRMNNINAYIDSIVIGGKHLIVAGSGTDNVKVTGDTIDRNGYYSGVVNLAYIANLAATKTLSVNIEEQQSDDGSNWDTATEVFPTTVVLTGASGGSTGATGVTTVAIDFANKKRYVRYNITADLNNTTSDTASWVATLIKGGAVVKPAS